MKTLTKIGVVGGLVAALGSGCDRTTDQDMSYCAIDMQSGAVICNQQKTSLEDVRAFYQETLPGLSDDAYRTEVFDKQGVFLGEIVLVDSNRLNEGVYQHGWFECPAGCKAIVGEDGSVYIKLSGNNQGGN